MNVSQFDSTMQHRIGRIVERVNDQHLFGKDKYDSREMLETLGFSIVPESAKLGTKLDRFCPPMQAYTYLVEVPEGWEVTNQGPYHTKFISPDKRTEIWSFIKSDPWDVQGWINITSDKI